MSDEKKPELLAEALSSVLLKKGLSSSNLETALSKKPPVTSQNEGSSEKPPKTDD